MSPIKLERFARVRPQKGESHGDLELRAGELGPQRSGGFLLWLTECMPNSAEVLANAVNAVSIALAGRRSVHTWWTGIVGCALFFWVFYEARLYADASLQIFFVATSVVGWWHWSHPAKGQTRVTHLPTTRFITYTAVGALVAAGYAMALRQYTDAAAPLPDSVVLATSVLGQLLLVERRVESWYFWLAANTVAVPLYVSRELYVTAALYSLFWVNALISLRHWRRQSTHTPEVAAG